jgi:hypothetical protein
MKATRIVVLIVALLAAIGYFGFSGYGGVKDAEKSVRGQLDAINQHDYAKAYGYYSINMKKKISEQDFSELVHKLPVLESKDCTFSSQKIETASGVVTLEGSLTGKNGQVAPVTYILVRENDQWVINGFKIGPPVHG